MYSPNTVYFKFLQKVNKNATQFNISCDKSRFVLIFNEAKNRWVETNLKGKDSIIIDNLRETIRQTPPLLTPSVSTDDYVEYPVPDDYYEHILTKTTCKKDGCKGTVYSREVKNQNKNILEFDANQKPDFDYEWTFNSIQGGNLRVYKTKDFEVLESVMEYYSAIPDFDIAGYANFDGTASKDAPIEIISDQYVDQIISLAAKEFMLDYESSTGIQAANERINSQS